MHTQSSTTQSNFGVTGGNPQLIGTIAKAAIATGADGLFIETHPNPSSQKVMEPICLRLDLLEKLLEDLVKNKKSSGIGFKVEVGFIWG